MRVSTDYLRRMTAASVFGIPDQDERDKIREAADEIDALRAAIRGMLGPDTYDIIRARSHKSLLGPCELAAIRRAFVVVEEEAP